MRASAAIARLALVLGCALALSGCGKYGPKGDRGLPPPPPNLAYPVVFPEQGREPNRTLKTEAEQRRIEADLLARKRQPRAAR